MPTNYQIMPTQAYPSTTVQINDNTQRTETFATTATNSANFLCVFTSPKGRDNVVQTIDGGVTALVDEYGLGSFAIYGQPYLNAYLAARSGNATIHAMRITAADAAYSTITVVARYKANDTNDGLEVKFFGREADAPVTDLNNLSTAVTIPTGADAEGFTHVRLFTIAYNGKGTYGKNIRFKISTAKDYDKLNMYKNYILHIYTNDGGLVQQEQFTFSMDPDALYNGASLFLQDVITDPTSGSDEIAIDVDTAGLQAVYDAYLAVQPTTTFTIADFDMLMGINKYNTTEAMPGYVIIPEGEATGGTPPTDIPITLENSLGVALMGGSEGAFDPTSPTFQDDVNARYLEAFNGTINPLIYSVNRYPTNFIMDANYPIDVKNAMRALAAKREDCVCILDCGTTITTKESVSTYVKGNFPEVLSYSETIEAYMGKIRDPYSNKSVTVTGTAWMAERYPTHIFNQNGKHVPLAGNELGKIETLVANSVMPVYEDGLDNDVMDELAEMRVNFARYNANQVVIRAMQDTRQSITTNLSELNNVLIIKDIIRDAKKLCDRYQYNFAEVDDIGRFNASLSTITSKYEVAQVKQIQARFDKNEWETENNIIHLYITIQQKSLVRDVIIELDIEKTTND